VSHVLPQLKLRQEANDVVYTVVGRGPDAEQQGDAAALRDYFNLNTSLVPLAQQWAAADKRFCDVSPYIPGLAFYHFRLCLPVKGSL
jgi:intraflagellar transport protein 122